MSDVPLYTQEQRIASLESALHAEREKSKRLREAGHRLVNAMLAAKRFRGPAADSDADMLTGIMWANLKAALSEAGEGKS